MKQHLLDTFAASTFNGCEHQKLPLMDGPELEMKVDKDATPTRVRVPATIPIYWKTKVKQSIDRDVEMGVLEWVPPNTPETWCSRMVVTPKQNGEPRKCQADTSHECQADTSHGASLQTSLHHPTQHLQKGDRRQERISQCPHH